ncbi:MAG TPA: indole-3-glycerol phosphate synthase TrpC [Chloroflexota bacterium]|nr:indole-3-glycerol phosphate synthase TrpC [Chloroflexota bacterium]
MILDDILAHKREELAAMKAKLSLAEMRMLADAAGAPAHDFHAALAKPVLSVIAEVKRRSPGAGAINEAVDPVAQAQTYEQAGASAISVLTDQRYFGGANADLQAIRQAVDLPMLRKDFTVDEYQVWEARAIGADAVLLIVGALEDRQLGEYQQLAHELGMAALVEVHNQRELDRALAADPRIIGINNRDLTTMTVDIQTTLKLRSRVPQGVTLASESGIRTPEHVRTVSEAGVDAILVGEALMASGDPAQLLQAFLQAAARVPSV